MDNLTNTPNFLSTFSALSRFENTKSIQTTVNGKHSIVSAKSAISKSGNPMVAIDFAHVRHDDNGIMDFLQTMTALNI
jgi:hypothetical protein